MEQRQRAALLRCNVMLVRDLRATDVLDHLVSAGVVSPDDDELIRAEKTRAEQVRVLLQLLPRRGGDAFGQLVVALRREYGWLADELQKQLAEMREPTSAATNDELNRMLRVGAVPRLPELVIPRVRYVTQVLDGLRGLPDGCFLAVHGMAGIGKSVCVNQALHDPLLLQLYAGGVFWVTVGQADHDTLINKVQALCERLSDDVSTAQLPPTIEIAIEKLRKLLIRRPQPVLLVLDDVWTSDVISLFDLDAQVLLTTRDESVLDRVDDRGRLIQIKDGFSLLESQELFSKRLKIPQESLPDEAADIHRRCEGAPMVIALLCSYLAGKQRGRDSTDRWRSCLNKIKQADYKKLEKQHSYAHSNVMDAIALSVRSLEDELAGRFSQLSVFGADVSIPCKVLCTYWSMSEEDVEHIMLDLVKKSLAQEMWDDKLETMFYSMHDLIIDYLDTEHSPKEKQSMHAQLVQRYLEQCAGDYGSIPDDEYMLWYMGHHVYHAGLYELFPRLYFSLSFVGNKLRVTGPSDLLSDYRKYAEFLDRAEHGEVRRRDFENFVRTVGHQLPPRPPADALAAEPSAAVVQLALCQPESSAVCQAAVRDASHAQGQLFLRWCNKEMMRWSNVLLTKVFSGSVCDVEFTHTANLALTAYGDGHIKLWNVITGDEYPAFRGHTERVQQLTVSPDGSRFVSASDDHTLKIWDLAKAILAVDGANRLNGSPSRRPPSPRVRHSSSGALRCGAGTPRDDSDQTLTGHTAGVMCVDWSRNSDTGCYIVSGDASGAFKVWDTLGGEIHQHEAAHDGNITCCTFSPDSTYFATGGADGRIKLWNTTNGTLLYTFSQHNLRVISLIMSEDNSSIVSVAEKEIFCWVWSEDRRPSRDYQALHMHSNSEHDLYLCSRLSRDQLQLVVGTSSNMYETWDLRQRRVIATQRGFAGSVTSLVFSHDGERLLAGAGDMVTSCSLTATPKVEESLQTLFSARFLTADPSSLLVAAITSNNGVQGRSDHELMILRGLEGTIQTTTKPVGEKIRITVINETGTMVAFGCEDGSVGVYEINAVRQAEPNILGKHMERVISLQFGPDNTIISGSEDNTMKVWWPDKTNVTCGGNKGAVTQVGLYDGSNGLIAVSCSRDGTLKDVDAAHLHVSDLEWGAARSDMAVLVHVYEMPTGRLLRAHLAHSGSTVTCYRIVRAVWSADGPENGRGSSPCPPDLVVVTAAVDGVVKMTRLSTGVVEKSFNLDQGPVRTFRLSADNTVLVTGHDDGRVVVTRTDHQCPPLRLDLHQSMVHDLAVSPDGRTVISIGDCLAWWQLSEGCSEEHNSSIAPRSPRLRPPPQQYFGYQSGRQAGGRLRVKLRQVLAFRGTLARQLTVSDDWTTLVTVDDAGVLYVMQTS